jgi:membrane associated rhomboid family serine protease
MTLTIAIIVVTALLSFAAFSNEKMMNDMIFHPPSVLKGQYYRFITSGLIHADIGHLAFNMFTLYFFGKYWEQIFIDEIGIPKYMYLVMYFGAMIVADIPSLIRHGKDYYYRSLGASGAVSAIVFSMILLMPWSTLYVFFLPLPAIVYGVLYLGYSIYMDRKGGDHINHGAHLWGAIFGIVFTIILKPAIVPFFIDQLQHPQFNF